MKCFAEVTISALALIHFAAPTAAVAADETLPVLKVGSDVYSNVTVTKVTATDLYFRYDKGLGNAKLKNLDAALQSHFHFDPTRARAAEQQQKAMDAQYRAQAAASASVSRPSPTADSPPPEMDANAITSEMENAMARVREIVNQPVTAIARTPYMQVSTYSPGWFHEGAQKPDFKAVDVRTSQELNYARHQYVTSDLNPGVVFDGRDLEFNAMTKYFYTDRTLPKKKLSEDEMLEINRLYRVIGRDEDLIAKLRH